MECRQVVGNNGSLGGIRMSVGNGQWAVGNGQWTMEGIISEWFEGRTSNQLFFYLLLNNGL